MDLAKNLKIDSVSRLEPAAPLSVEASQSVGEAVALMRREKVGCVLVTAQGSLAGIFTERDLLKRILAPGRLLSTPLHQVMTPDPEVVRVKEPVASAIRRMEEGGYRHLPVIDAGGKPVGILSVKRIVHYLVEHFPATIYNLPPNPGTVPNEAEGA